MSRSRLPLGVCLAAGLGWAMAAAAQNVSEQYLLAAANQDRVARGLSAVRVDEHLVLAARMHAYQMAEHGAISHQFDGEQELADRAGESGAHFSFISENVAQASNSAKIHEMWMASPGHRANLLDPNVNAVGIAVVQKGGQLYAVEDFASAVPQLTIVQQEALVGSLLTTQGLSLGGDTGDARQTCTMSTGFVGERQPSFVLRYSTSELDHLPKALTAKLDAGRYREATVGACVSGQQTPFTTYHVAVMLFP